MEKVLSLFFNTDRTYVCIIANNPKGLELEYINSTQNPIFLEDLQSNLNQTGMIEFENLMEKVPKDFTRISLVFPAESIMITQIPGSKNLTKEQILAMVIMEMKRAYTNFEFSQYKIDIFQFAPNLKGENKLLAVIFQNSDLDIFKNFLFQYEKPVTATTISQIAASNAFLYNYPELRTSNSAIIGIQSNFIDFSVISNSEIVYYNLLSYPSAAEIPELIEQELNKATTEFVADLSGGAYFFGADLNKEIMLSCWEIAMLFGIEAKRLNSFRMVKSSLGVREKDYASRTMQIYPPAIGAALPYFFPSLTL